MRWAAPAGAVAAIAMWLTVAGAAWPQGAPPPRLGVQDPAAPATPSPGLPAPSSAAQAAPENPGLIDEIGKLFDKSIAILPPLKTPQQTIDELNRSAAEAANEASAALSRLGKASSMVSGRAKCPVSANGAPDCKSAADQLCRSSGFKEGRGMDGDSAESCSAKVLIPGRKRKPDDCRTDHYVIRALCL